MLKPERGKENASRAGLQPIHFVITGECSQWHKFPAPWKGLLPRFGIHPSLGLGKDKVVR